MASEADTSSSNVVTGDSGPGTGLRDLLPLPSDPRVVTDPDSEETADTLNDDVTLSHALATGGHGEKGIVHERHDEPEVADLGWNEKKQDIAEPLVGGLHNEDLWLLVRRFNKQMYHVKSVAYPVPGNLDLNIADEEEFSPDKLRANLERLYTTVGVGVLGAVKHVARLRSWRETRRTSCFLLAYSLAWVFDFIVPLIATTLLVLILYAPSRGFLFPPAPLALVSSKSGGVQKPKSGVLASHDSATGAPENHKGEAVEQEASNFVNGVASIAISSVAGKHPQGDPDTEDEPGGVAAPDPTMIASAASDAKVQASDAKSKTKHDKTKVPMETAMWSKMRPIMHAIGDITDTWERLANALSPTPPFPRETHRLRIATLVVPLLGISFFVSSYMFVKGMTFGVGFGFFGDPIISRGLDWLNRVIPHWQKLLELRNTILKGVPTNAQLTITLLRIGEANKAPLPPPPRIGSPPADEPADLTDANLRATGAEPPLNATDSELDAAIQHDPSTAHQTSGDDITEAKAHKHGRFGSKLLGMFRGTAAGGIKTAIGIDSVRAAAGSRVAKDRLGVVPRPPGADKDRVSGPVDFVARYKGHKGHVYITTSATIPSVAFSTNSTIEKIGSQDREDLHPLWSVAVADIVELKKIGGYGWKAKLVVGWSLGREVADDLEITVRDGQTWKVTACPLREELFNRLVAMGGQKWEAW